jgi:hypothetical protein
MARRRSLARSKAARSICFILPMPLESPVRMPGTFSPLRYLIGCPCRKAGLMALASSMPKAAPYRMTAFRGLASPSSKSPTKSRGFEDGSTTLCFEAISD